MSITCSARAADRVIRANKSGEERCTVGDPGDERYVLSASMEFAEGQIKASRATSSWGALVLGVSNSLRLRPQKHAMRPAFVPDGCGKPPSIRFNHTFTRQPSKRRVHFWTQRYKHSLWQPGAFVQAQNPTVSDHRIGQGCLRPGAPAHLSAAARVRQRSWAGYCTRDGHTALKTGLDR